MHVRPGGDPEVRTYVLYVHLTPGWLSDDARAAWWGPRGENIHAMELSFAYCLWFKDQGVLIVLTLTTSTKEKIFSDFVND